MTSIGYFYCHQSPDRIILEMLMTVFLVLVLKVLTSSGQWREPVISDWVNGLSTPLQY